MSNTDDLSTILLDNGSTSIEILRIGLPANKGIIVCGTSAQPFSVNKSAPIVSETTACSVVVVCRKCNKRRPLTTEPQTWQRAAGGLVCADCIEKELNSYE